MKKIVLIPNSKKDVQFSVTNRVVELLSEMNVEIFVSSDSLFKS